MLLQIYVVHRYTSFLRSVLRLTVTPKVVPNSPTLMGWNGYVPPKRRSLQELHGVTSQTAFFNKTYYPNF
jgi:hypothetical protein